MAQSISKNNHIKAPNGLIIMSEVYRIKMNKNIVVTQVEINNATK